MARRARRSAVAALLVLLFALVGGVLALPQQGTLPSVRSPTGSTASAGPGAPPTGSETSPESNAVDGLPTAVPAGRVASATQAVPLDPGRVRRALLRLVDDPRLGRHVSVVVTQATDGRPVFRLGRDPMVPASTLKLLTATAALERLGPDHRFTTRVVAGARPGRVVLIGGGDPFLERSPSPNAAYPPRATLRALAVSTASALRQGGGARGSGPVRLRFDDSLFSGPAASPRWEPSYLPDNVVSPITALWVDEGEEHTATRAADPSEDAAEAFAAELAKQGVRVLGRPTAGVAPAAGDELAAVESAPLDQIVSRTLEVSDNEAAEVLLRHVGLAEGRGGSFVGGAAAVRGVLGRLGIDLTGARIVDGSGLSRQNLLPAPAVAAVLRLAVSDRRPDLRPVVTGLPIAGFTGSLRYRFARVSPFAYGTVRAKTGTLSGVHALAGVAITRDGAALTFVAMTDRVALRDTLVAQRLLDRMAAALAACSCAAT